MGFLHTTNPFTEHTTNPFQAAFPGEQDFGLEQEQGSQAKPRSGHPTKTRAPGSSLFSQDSSSVGSTSHTPVFQENCSAPAWSGAPLGSGSPAGSRALEVMERRGLLVPMFSGWSAGKGTTPPPPGYPQRGGLCGAEGLVSDSFGSFRWGCQSLPFIIQPQQLQNFPGCLSCYYG